MNLMTNPDIKNWNSHHYVFVEKSAGSLPEMAQNAWKELNSKIAEISKENKISDFTSLYKTEPQFLYRAGVFVSEKPKSLPTGFKYEYFNGGNYLRFTLMGSYSQLPEACGKVFQIVKERKLPLREDFYLENYVNDPQTTPQENCITEILVPTI